MVGLAEVLQQMPREVTVEPPQFVTLPPLVAVLAKIAETVFVLTTGTVSDDMVANVTTLP